MNKYKVEIVQKETFIVDVLAENEEKAKTKATKKWNEIANNGMQHYHQTGDTETDFGTIYDVSHTEDPFNP